MEPEKLNIDYAGSVSKLVYLLKQYQIRKREFKVFFRGKSFDFETYRNYSSDDDAGTIDWVASARFNKLLVKQYREEEKQTVIFLIDVGENMVLGSGKKLKCEIAAELALSLAYIILNGDNRVGFVLFNKGIKLFFPPMRGKRCFYSFYEALSNPKNYEGGSDINVALDYMSILPRYPAASAILVSDFVKFDDKTKSLLLLNMLKFETMAFIIKDKLDMELPQISGEFVVEDPESGEQILVDPILAKQSYGKEVKKREASLKGLLKGCGVDFLEIMTDSEFFYTLVDFMMERIKLRVMKK